MNKINSIDIDLDIIQPCFNPLKGWEVSLLRYSKELFELMPGVVINFIVVNDGSKGIDEKNIEFLKKNLLNFQFVTYRKNQGKGHALRNGVSLAKGKYQIYTDIDFPFQVNHIQQIYQFLTKGNDIVVGIRKQDYYDNLYLRRYIYSKGLQIMNKLFLNLSVCDTQSGIKGFSKRGREIFLKTSINRFLFDTEFLAIAIKCKNVKVKFLRVSLREGVIMSNMNFKTILKEGYNYLRIFLKVRLS